MRVRGAGKEPIFFAPSLRRFARNIPLFHRFTFGVRWLISGSKTLKNRLEQGVVEGENACIVFLFFGASRFDRS